MNSVYFDSNSDDALRRRFLYDGQVFVFSPRPNTLALCDLARELCEEAFSPHHPPAVIALFEDKPEPDELSPRLSATGI